MRKNNIKKAQLFKWAQRAVGIVLAVSYIMALYSVISTDMVPAKYLAFTVPVSFLIVAVLVIASFKTSKLSRNKRIGIIIASAIMIVANIYVFSISSNTMSFLNNIQDDGYTYEQYSIISKKDRHISLVSDNIQNMGIIKNDVNNNSVKTQIKNITNPSDNSAKNFADLSSVLSIKSIKSTVIKNESRIIYKDYDEITSLTVALDTKSVDMAIVKSNYLQLLSENYDTFYQSIEVINTFKIKTGGSVSTTKTDVSKPFVLYISGIDTYGDISTVSRSDVNIMVVVNPQTHKILLVNTPRDYYVQLHGTTGVRDKLTHAGIYGIDMSVQTMADLYSVPINYYLRINFSSLTNIVDVLGGVDVISEYNFSAGDNKYVVGVNHLNGSQALSFARERHSFEAGDRTRGQNQQRVIEAIIAKMNNPNTLVKYQQILASLQRTIQTDMDSDSITTLIKNQLDNMIKWSVESISVTGADSHNVTYSMGNLPLYVMEPDADSLNAAKAKIQQYIK